MRLLIINENPLEKIDQDYYSIYSWIRFPVQLAEQCQKVTLWSPIMVRDVPSPDVWLVELGNLNIEEHDYYESFAQYYRLLPLRFLKWRKKTEQLIKKHDAVVLRVPSPMISVITRCALRQKKPLVLIIAGDIVTGSSRVIASSGLKRLIYLILVNFLALQEKKWAKCATMVYVYSNEIKQRLRIKSGNVKLMQTPHVSLLNFKYRSDTCQSNRVRLLRVCWLMPNKGIEYLLKAVAILVKKGLPLELEIAGKEREPGYQAKLQKLAEQLGVTNRIFFTGWVPFDRIWKVYVRSDIQIISSVAEGMPRCIVEGAARGLPLVSTTAGGCADTLTHKVNAFLIPPQDAQSIAEAVEQLIRDKRLRQGLIRGGYDMARGFTFEEAGKRFLNDLRRIAGL